jgi:hypothetical protein
MVSRSVEWESCWLCRLTFDMNGRNAQMIDTVRGIAVALSGGDIIHGILKAVIGLRRDRAQMGKVSFVSLPVRLEARAAPQ